MTDSPPRHPPSVFFSKKVSRMNAPQKLGRYCIVALFFLGAATSGLSQVNQDQAAEMLLNSARKAFNEKNFPFAVQRYKEFLGKFGGHKLANDARYGLALALIDAP